MDWARRFILFHGKRHPQDLGAVEVRASLESLVLERHVAIATQKQALNALGFLYEQFCGKSWGRWESLCAPVGRRGYRWCSRRKKCQPCWRVCGVSIGWLRGCATGRDGG